MQTQDAGYVWHEGDVEWNAVTTLTYPAICSLAGVVAGMFGVGGGIIKISPLGTLLRCSLLSSEDFVDSKGTMMLNLYALSCKGR